MSNRYKCRASAKYVEKQYPHHVDMVVPAGGLGNRLDAMYLFHTQHGITRQCGHGARDIIRWCFADAEIAKKFATEFSSLVAMLK
jgi:hypothetical protein